MNPADIGKAYDQITQLWQRDSFNRHNGIDAHQRAIAWVEQRGNALDVGCGCTGRFIDLLLSHGFTPTGVDVSAEMLRLARARHPAVMFYQQDICLWQPPQQYDFISAWDSIWHVPLSQQAPLITKLLDSLNPGGLLIFSFGGTDKPGEHIDASMGPAVYYSTLGVHGFLQLCMRPGFVCRHMEYDQHPELHAYLVVQRLAAG